MSAARLACVTVVLLLSFAVDRAEAAPAGVDIGLFRPPATAGGLLSIDSAYTAGHLKVAASLFVDYAHEPLVLRAAGGGTVAATLRHQLTLQAAVSASFWNRLEIGVVIPAILYQRGDAAGDGSRPSTSAIGDFRLEAKVHLAAIPLGGGGRAVGFGLAVGLGLPTGDPAALAGNDGVTVWPRLMVTFLVRPVELVLELGAVLRGSRILEDVAVGQQLRFGLGARVAIYRGLGITATLAGAGALSGTRGEVGVPLEILAGPDYRWKKVPIDVLIAAGRGLTEGLGAPNARVVVGLRYQPRVVLDRDRDGVPDVEDRCPREAGERRNAGCPDRDRDQDGLLDGDDRCPDQAGPRSNQGCPDTDADHDGVVDRLDRCVDVPGPADNAGCPYGDRDKDGALDRDDRCPDEAGPSHNGGCPDLDADQDGIPDRLDRCPQEKENFNGVEDDDGCPDLGPELAVLTEKSIDIRRQIFFETRKATIKGASFQVLVAVAKIIELHPEIAKLRIEGHTDSQGGRAYNLRLSQARAEAVRKHLVEVLGVDATRLTSQGFGPDQPIADNRTDAGRARNRRTSFMIEEKRGSER